MPREMIDLLAPREEGAARQRAEAARAHEAAIQAVLRMGASRVAETRTEEDAYQLAA